MKKNIFTTIAIFSLILNANHSFAMDIIPIKAKPSRYNNSLTKPENFNTIYEILKNKKIPNNIDKIKEMGFSTLDIISVKDYCDKDYCDKGKKYKLPTDIEDKISNLKKEKHNEDNLFNNENGIMDDDDDIENFELPTFELPTIEIDETEINTIENNSNNNSTNKNIKINEFKIPKNETSREEIKIYVQDNIKDKSLYEIENDLLEMGHHKDLVDCIKSEDMQIYVIKQYGKAIKNYITRQNELIQKGLIKELVIKIIKEEKTERDNKLSNLGTKLKEEEVEPTKKPAKKIKITPVAPKKQKRKNQTAAKKKKEISWFNDAVNGVTSCIENLKTRCKNIFNNNNSSNNNKAKKITICATTIIIGSIAAAILYKFFK